MRLFVLWKRRMTSNIFSSLDIWHKAGKISRKFISEVVKDLLFLRESKWFCFLSNIGSNLMANVPIIW